MKKYVSLLLALAMVFALCACSSTDTGKNSEEGLTVGFCASDSTNPVFIKCEQWLKQQCEADGNTLMTKYYETDAAKFLDICENFIIAGCDIIIVQDPDENISADVLSRAKEAGIIVCTLDTDNEFATYVQEDQNEEAGRLLAQEAIKYINENLGGKCRIVSYDCPQSETMKVRNEVFIEEVLKACPGSEVACEIDVWNVNADWVGLGETSMQAAGDAYIIVSVADVCTLGALEAYKTAGHDATEGYAAFSFDATEAAIAEMTTENSILHTSIYMGYPDVVQKLYTSAVNTAKTGEVTDRYCAADLIAIDKDNYEQIG